MPAPAETCRWAFDELPPSGARRGGDPSEHVFRRDLATLVREVIQNANDQAVSWPRLRFRLIELQGERLEAYLSALAWPSLREHLEGASGQASASALREALDRLDRARRLLVLNIEDSGTVGLTGHETEGESHFRALCKDTLYSHKSSESAGGSYGLGKSVLWAFSGLGTVLFNSVLLGDPPGHASPRLIGRAELASHPISTGRWHTGSGWFGRIARTERGERAESIWTRQAEARAEPLLLSRAAEQIGTTIQIVGFRDPAAEERSVDELGAAIDAASRLNFWPAMLCSRRQLKIERVVGAESRPVDPRVDPELRPFIACLEGRERPAAGLDAPGDIAVRTLPIAIPGGRDGSEPLEGQVELVVRLQGEGEGAQRLAGHVAMFREPGMVVRYWDRRGLMVGMRPFHAILLAGGVRDRDAAIDRAVERFLRAAEPPGHDLWCPTPALRQSYKPGWGKALERLERRITEALKSLLAPRLAQGSKGPDRLQRRFPIGKRGSKGGAPSEFHFSNLDARFDGERWHFEGRIERERKGPAWSLAMELHELGEGGARLGSLGIERVAAGGADATVSLATGVARLRAPATLRSVVVRGVSVSLASRPEPPAELSFELTALLEAPA